MKRRIAGAPAGLRWDRSYTWGFWVYEVTDVAWLRAQYRKERRNTDSPGAARTFTLIRAGQERKATQTHAIVDNSVKVKWQ
jgi:hypothetical protein